MPTISSKISKRELDAIQEYANQCGETTSNLIRKTVLDEAVFQKFYWDAKEYDCGIYVAEGNSNESQFVLDKINQIRRILGLKEQDEI